MCVCVCVYTLTMMYIFIVNYLFNLLKVIRTNLVSKNCNSLTLIIFTAKSLNLALISKISKLLFSNCP